jgi:hypothetical protein
MSALRRTALKQSPKQMGENVFMLDLPTLMGIHPIFNVDPLKHYKPSMLDKEEEESMTFLLKSWLQKLVQSWKKIQF